MFTTTEAKFQVWRALAVLADRSERLLYLGRSTAQVKAGYLAAYEEVLDTAERARVRAIALQCWSGAADRGAWIPKADLPVPAAAARSA